MHTLCDLLNCALNFHVSCVLLPSVFQYGFMVKLNFVKTAGFNSAGHVIMRT